MIVAVGKGQLWSLQQHYQLDHAEDAETLVEVENKVFVKAN